MLDIMIDNTEYQLHKSYRHYVQDNDSNFPEIEFCLKQSRKKLTHYLNGSTGKKNLQPRSLKDISLLLKPISWLQLTDKALPKALYPSAGSTYSVRCYLMIHQALPDLESECYYFDPLEKTLARCDYSFIKNNKNTLLSINLVAYWPAITPLYAEKSKQFAFIEAGHMLALLIPELSPLGFQTEITISEKILDDENTLLAQLSVYPLVEKNNQNIEETNFFSITNIKVFQRTHENTYAEINGSANFNFNQEDIFFQMSDIAQLLVTGNVLLCIEGDVNYSNLIYSGMLFQLLSQTLHQHSLGGCVLGFEPTAKTLYSMVIGKIGTVEKSKSESHVNTVNVKEIIESYLIHWLPQYMWPHSYVVLNQVPLTSNGL